jgi:hypothetical protein
MGRQCTATERLKAWWTWQIADWAWGDAASLCIERMKAEVTP